LQTEAAGKRPGVICIGFEHDVGDPGGVEGVRVSLDAALGLRDGGDHLGGRVGGEGEDAVYQEGGAGWTRGGEPTDWD
jgi:hypothetical protein